MRGGRWCASGRRASCRSWRTWRIRILPISASRSIKRGASLIVVSCLDNLGKGAAGQAVQNFNHMLGIEEHTALQ